MDSGDSDSPTSSAKSIVEARPAAAAARSSRTRESSRESPPSSRRTDCLAPRIHERHEMGTSRLQDLRKSARHRPQDPAALGSRKAQNRQRRAPDRRRERRDRVEEGLYRRAHGDLPPPFSTQL